MQTRELVKLIDLCEEKFEDYVFVKLYGDGSGGLYSENSEEGEMELATWDDESEMEVEIKKWLKK